MQWKGSSFAGLVFLGVLLAAVVPAPAQSGSRNYPAPGSAPREQPARATLALEGYCPVSVLEMREWVKGDPAYQVVYDGRLYRFANQQGKQMFEADPVKYAPALGGDCTVALVRMGKRVPGNIRQAVIHGGRLFLFSNEDARQLFRADAAPFVDADLALEGNCAVCLVNMRRDIPGKAEFAAIHNGFRYLFPSAELRDQFLAEPGKYVATTGPGSGTPGAPAARPPVDAGSGSR
jgi:YHS domain-containing protein